MPSVKSTTISVKLFLLSSCPRRDSIPSHRSLHRFSFVCHILSLLYSSYSFQTGVLQGDCLSPLLFNLCFNTFIQFVKQEKYNQLGFSSHDENDRLFHPVHWFQFADDAAVITTNERENQSLLNCFSRWCQWASMQIRVEKCITFGIKTCSTC